MSHEGTMIAHAWQDPREATVGNSGEERSESVTLSLFQQNGPEMKGLASGMGIENRN